MSRRERFSGDPEGMDAVSGVPRVGQVASHDQV